jgi:two-component system, OmpR family, response regulator
MKDINKILYIEDELDIQAITKIALCDIGGFTLEICSSGKEAIQKISSFNPDLILIDVMMPEMDGPETLIELKKIKGMESIPVIFMTAKVQKQEITYYKSLGAINVISKPFDPMNLAQQIKNILQ